MIKEILEKAKQNGKKVDGLGEDALATVGTILEGVLAPISTQLKTIGEQLTAATAKNAELEKKLGEVSTASTAAADPKGDKSKTNGKEGEDANAMPAWFKDFAARFEKLESNVTGKDKAASASQLLDGVLKSKFPNLKLTERQRARFLNAGIDTADKLEAEIRAELDDLKALGVTPGSSTANPEAEGAKDTKAAVDKTKEQAAIKKVKEIGGTGF